MWRINMKVLFNNGKSKTYRSYFTNFKECKKLKQKYINLFQKGFAENIKGYFIVKNDVIRLKDISAINFRIGIF